MVIVVQVGDMLVLMFDGPVPVRVRVGADEGGHMLVVVVPVVVAVLVLVVERLVDVPMGVSLGGVKEHSERKKRCAQRGEQPRVAVT